MTAWIGVFGEAMVRACVLAAAVALGLHLLRVRHARVQKRAWAAVLLVALAMPALVFWRVPSVAVTTPALRVGHVLEAARLAWARVRGSVPAAAMAVAAEPAPGRPEEAAGKLAFLPRLRMVDRARAGLTAAISRDTVRARAGTEWSGGPAEVASLSIGRQDTAEPLRHSLLLPRVFGYSWPFVAMALYLLVAAGLLARIAVGLLLAARMWRHAVPFATDITPLPVRRTGEIAAPVTLGSGILLPEGAVHWDSHTLRGVLAHEAAHVRERDFYLQLLASLHVALFWVSPLAWWLRPQLARLSEIVCDRAALENNMDGLSYAQLLLRFSSAAKTPAGMVAMARSAGLRERVERLLADPQLASYFRYRRTHALAALVVVGVSAWGTAATVRIVRPAAVVRAQNTEAANAGPASAGAPVAPPTAPAPAANVSAAPVLAATAPAEGTAAAAAHSESESSSQGSGSSTGTGMSAASAVSLTVPVSLTLPAAAGPTVSLATAATTESTPRTYAIFGPDGESSMVVRGWYRDGDLIQKQHAKHPGAAIWFEKDGKAWVIDDPALIREAQAAYAPVEALGRQQSELGEKQGALGDKQGQLGDLQGELGDKLGQLGERQGAMVPQHLDVALPPDFSKTLQELTDAQIRLALDQPALSAADRAKLAAQRKDAEAKMQSALAQIEAQAPTREAAMKQMNEQRVPVEQAMRAISEQMRELGRQQGLLGAQQGTLGRQQGDLGRRQHAASDAASAQVQALIDRALRDGKAHPVE